MLPMQSGGREVVSLDESLKCLKVSAFKGHFPGAVSLENLIALLWQSALPIVQPVSVGWRWGELFLDVQCPSGWHWGACCALHWFICLVESAIQLPTLWAT